MSAPTTQSSPSETTNDPKQSKRVVFTFDPRSFRMLEDIKDDGSFTSYADAVRMGLQILRALQKQAGDGYTEVCVRKSNGQERTLVLPDIGRAE